jgi:hypothetical protein
MLLRAPLQRRRSAMRTSIVRRICLGSGVPATGAIGSEQILTLRRRHRRPCLLARSRRFRQACGRPANRALLQFNLREAPPDRARLLDLREKPQKVDLFAIDTVQDDHSTALAFLRRVIMRRVVISMPVGALMTMAQSPPRAGHRSTVRKSSESRVSSRSMRASR